MALDLEKLRTEVQASFQSINVAVEKDLVLVIGKTGAGKSTTVNYMLEFPMMPGDGGHAVSLEEDVEPPAKMEDSPTSVTWHPTPYLDKTGISYCDCPGFNDTRGPEARVTISVSMEAVTKVARSIRGVMAVIDWGSIDGSGRGSGIKDVARTLGSLFRRSADVADSLIFIITRVNPYVKKPYVKKKLDQLVEATEKRCAELKAQVDKQNSGTGAYIDYKDDTTGEDSTEKELSDQLVMLPILKLMQSKIDSVILINVFDEGQSRQMINAQIKRLKPLSAKDFNFADADNSRQRFRYIMIGEMQKFIELAKQYHEILPGKLSETETALAASKAREKECIELKTDLESGRAFQGEDDPILKSHREEIAKLKALIKAKRTEITTLDDSKEGRQRELWRIDTEDEVILYDREKDLKHDIDEDGVDISSGGGAVAYGIASGLTLGLSLVADGIYAHSKKKQLDFKYNDVKFTRVDESHARGEFRRAVWKPEKGEYHGVYTSARFRADRVRVIIYGRKCDAADHPTKIAELGRLISADKHAIEEARDAIEEAQDKTTELEMLVREFLTDQKVDRGIQLERLSGQLKTTETKTAAIEKEIESIKDELKIHSKAITEKFPFYLAISEIIAVIDLSSSNYPRIIPDFTNTLLRVSKDATLPECSFDAKKLEATTKAKSKYGKADGTASVSDAAFFSTRHGAAAGSGHRRQPPDPPAKKSGVMAKFGFGR